MNQQLQRALHALRGIRQRYETRRDVGSNHERSFILQLALDKADMLWIAATIDALEKTVAANSN